MTSMREQCSKDMMLGLNITINQMAMANVCGDMGMCGETACVEKGHREDHFSRKPSEYLLNVKGINGGQTYMDEAGE